MPRRPLLLRQSLERLGNKIKACYDRSTKRDPNMSGEVVLVITLSQYGRPISVEATSSSPSLAALLPCMKAKALTVRFPPPEPGAEQLRCPIRFVRA